MRILCVSAQKPDSTGSGVYLTETVKGFLAAGHEVTIIAGIDRDDAPELPAGVRFRPVRYRTDELPFPVCGMSDEMPYLATRYRDLTPEMTAQFKAAFSRAFDEVLADFRPDLIVSHHLYLVTAVLAHRELPCPAVAVSHSTDLRQMRSHGLERDFIVEGVRRLDGICALHDAQAQEICELYGVPAERVAVVGTGYNDAVFRPEGAADATAPQAVPADAPGPVRVAYAGKIWRKKGVGCLLRCLERLPYAAGGFELHLAGGFAHQDEYDRMTALAQEARERTGYGIEFLGKLPQDELAEVYRSSDLFVLPSFFEGLPLVVVEALACGCTVVVTDLPGIRPWLEREMPGAPVVYVEPPRMETVDEPAEGEEGPFEVRLAEALERAAGMPKRTLPADVLARLAWRNVAQRIVDSAQDGRARTA